MKKIIGFVTSGLEFNGNSINEKSLGGSESALYYLAKELAKLGNDVYVYCKCDKPGIYDNVVYEHSDKFRNGQYPYLDVCIISRFTDFLQKPIESNLNILWMHDIPVEPLFHQLWQVDGIFCMTEYQKSLYAKEKYIGEMVHVTKNGFDSEMVLKTIHKSFEKKKHNYVYASRPERGLKFLLEKIWPRVLELDPHGQLHICGYQNNLEVTNQHQELYIEINKLIDESDNVNNLGNLSKSEYYKLLGKSGFMLYPTDFPEISCINAIEAQANGCLVISTNNYALTETVKSDTLIDSEYASNEYIEKFLNCLKKNLDKITYDIETEIAKTEIQSYAWNNVALEWNSKFDEMFVTRFEKNKAQIANNLIYKSDIYAAWKLTGDKEYKQLLDVAKKNNLNFDAAIEDEEKINHSSSPRIQAIINCVKQYIEPDKKYSVLDLGCYTGGISNILLKTFSNIDKLYAYDASTDALEYFKNNRNNEKITYINDDVLNLEKHNLKVDIVIIGELLEHIEDTTAFLDMLMTVAKDNTLFLFTVPYGPWESLKLKDHPDEILKKINHIHHFEFSDILQIFEDVQETFFITRGYLSLFSYRGDKLDNWVFGFKYKYKPKFNKINYEEKALRTRPYASISACLIVKNEEGNILRCLKSIEKISDEIIIVDTGSTDNTKELAKRFTNKIFDYKWNDSFEDARNFSLEKASCDWILYIDADEELYESKILGKISQSDFYEGVVLEQRQISVNSENLNENQNPTRLFKNHRGIKFYGVIHELPGYDENTLVEKSLNQRESYLAHYGYINRDTIMFEKLDRNHDLLKKDIEKYPNRWFNKTYYIRDMYFLHIRDANKTGRFDSKYHEEIVEMWEKTFKGKNKNDMMWKYAKSLAFQFIQLLYNDSLNYKFTIRNNLPITKKISFKDMDDVEIRFLNEQDYLDFLDERKEEIRTEPLLNLFPILVAKLETIEKKDVVVPCEECNACCKNFDVYLTQEEVLSGKYKMEFLSYEKVNSLRKKELPQNSGAFRLARNNNKYCYYLINEKCSIYDDRPYACRSFDCRIAKEFTEEIKEVVYKKFNIKLIKNE